MDGEASPDVVDDPDGEQRRDGDGEWDDTSHEDRDSGNASGDDLDGDGRRLRDVQEVCSPCRGRYPHLCIVLSLPIPSRRRSI